MDGHRMNEGHVSVTELNVCSSIVVCRKKVVTMDGHRMNEGHACFTELNVRTSSVVCSQ